MRVKELRPAVVALVLAPVVWLAACGGQSAPPSGPPPNAVRVDESKAGAISGRVVLEGEPAPNAPITMAADPECMRQNPDGANFETIVAKDGGLENVFVYVKDGLGNYYFDVPAQPVKLDQKSCRYHPHVFGVRVGQPVEISNSDPTLHNVHAVATANQEFNFPQAVPGMKSTRTFTKPEVMVQFRCDVHNWMNAYVGVLDHPYFGVTSNGGRFELKGIPAGTYTIEAWHEKLGTRTERVTLGEKETKDISFTFKAASVN
jgi:plastocyanin